MLKFPTNTMLSAVDDARLSRIEAALPAKRFGQTTYSDSALAVPSSGAVASSGKISPSSGIVSTGNTFTFVVQGQFGFVWNGSTLGIYWDGTNGSTPFVIRRADNSQLSIPKGSIQIGALASGTNYGFAPFIAVSQPDHVSFVVGDSGSPRFSFSPNASSDTLSQAAQSQRLSTNERLTDGLIYFTPSAAGTSTNGDGEGTYTGN